MCIRDRFINSIALIADGVHSLSDVSTSGVVILGFKSAKKQPDKEHPFGHGRAEYVATLVIAVILIFVGFGFIQQSIERIINLENIVHQDYIFIIVSIVLSSAVAKELMARYSFAISKKINSDVLKGDAWHHRSDAISSVGVAIGLLGARYGFPILDPIFGIVVSAIIIYVGIDLLKTSANYLIGSAPDEKTVEEIKKIAQSTSKVKDVDNISIHDYGTTKIATLHAKIDDDLLLDQAHAISDELENKIKDKTNLLSIIHLEPEKGSKDPTLKTRIERLIKKEKQIISFHKVKIMSIARKQHVNMHLIVDKNMTVEKTHKLNHRLQDQIKKICKDCIIDIHFDPCIKNCKKCDIYCTDKKY